MNARSDLRNWLDAEITPLLRASRFARKGLTYSRSTADVQQLVAFQPSRFATDGLLEFGVYGGVCSFRLLEDDASRFGETTRTPIRLVDCHVQIPLFVLLGERIETWWTVEAESASDLGRQFQIWIEDLLLPELDKRTSDDALATEYLAKLDEDAIGPVGLRRLLFLLREIGPTERISDVETALDGAVERRLVSNLQTLEEGRDIDGPL
jgi:hypothetical protein